MSHSLLLLFFNSVHARNKTKIINKHLSENIKIITPLNLLITVILRNKEEEKKRPKINIIIFFINFGFICTLLT